MEGYVEGEGSEDGKTKCTICVAGAKSLTIFILSHVGLITLVVGYCLIGAVIFEALEAEHELEVKKDMVKIREMVSHDLWAMTRKVEIIIPEIWAENATKRLQEFETELLKAMKKNGWDGNEGPDQQWTFTGALFYSIVVVTTIGYGHITPKTLWGKIVTIFYAIVGIPLMVICWSNLGEFMANVFRFCYWRVCCFVCTRESPRDQNIRRGKSVRGPRHNTPSGSVRGRGRSIRRSQRTSQRSADSAMSDSQLSTASDPGLLAPNLQARGRSRPSPLVLGFGPIHGPTPRSQSQTRSAKGEAPPVDFAPKPFPIVYNKYAEELNLPIEQTQVATPGPGGQYSRTVSAPAPYVPQQEFLDYWEEEDEEEISSGEVTKDLSTRPVPIWLCSFLVIGYIIGGAYLFSGWEHWSFLDSAYFCFISLTTIGFGDFVPQGESKEGIALCSVYLLFGIALLAMAFNLVQEQVISNVKKLAMKLGIIDEEE